MANENPRAQVGPRTVPSVEVDPSNELLDGDALPLPADLEDSNTVIDASGTRLEDADDPTQIPPPQSANLELRLRLEKTLDAFDESIGRGPEKPDEWIAALEAERDGLKGRAENSFGEAKERAANRLSQVEKALSDRKGSRRQQRQSSAAERAISRAQERREASGEDDPKLASPSGRTNSPEAKTTAAQEAAGADSSGSDDGGKTRQPRKSAGSTESKTNTTSTTSTTGAEGK